ncbi:MAG: histidine--tRNA ligase [Francisellaceae bacterium]
MSKLQAVRGMNDILPDEIGNWHYFESMVIELLKQFNYHEIRMPIVEKSELFHRGVGEGTDIVEKETYDFLDRNGESLTLRPEGTASCVRAMIEHGMLRNQQQKLFYIGPMYRHERPQKGRYRQFYQLGVEVYGASHIAADAELITLNWQLWQKLGLVDHVKLEINNLGTAKERQDYTKALVEYLTPLNGQLDKDSQRRLGKNPLRILDSKNEQTRKLLQNAPVFDDYLSEASKADFAELCNYLKSSTIPFTINPHLVRGIDYYTNTVFEWTTDKLGAQGTICAGGRYDGLVTSLNGPDTPAVGFAMGIERILLLLQTLALLPQATVAPDIYIISDSRSIFKAMEISSDLRIKLPQLCIEQNTTPSSIKSQFKKADKSGAKIALVIAENEIKNQSAVVKFLREDKPQQSIAFDRLADQLSALY